MKGSEKNDLLVLTGAFDMKSNPSSGMQCNFVKDVRVTTQHLEKLIKEFSALKSRWSGQKYIEGALVSVYYTQVVAKSNRARSLLSTKDVDASTAIKGAKFRHHEDGHKSHIITYHVSLKAIEESINRLEKAKLILSDFYGSVIDKGKTDKIKQDDLPKEAKVILKKSPFLQIIHDAYYIESVGVEETHGVYDKDSLVSIFDLGEGIGETLRRFGITVEESKIINNSIVLLTAKQLNKLVDVAPYMISMGALTDFRQIADRYAKDDSISPLTRNGVSIPPPRDEPVIGVIDTHFDQRAYFSDWVQYENCLDKEIELSPEDFYHGTAVTSIIVDGPRANPNIDDHCGRFRVRHFGVSLERGYRTSAILKTISRVVSENQDIKIWNLSLGSDIEIDRDFISPEAAFLDEIQVKYGVLFVVAGTNIPADGKDHQDMRLGAPADSLNALVVNAVNYNNEPASYSRKGPVLSFFHKPDVSYYGGDEGDQYDAMSVCRVVRGRNIVHYAAGTSYAAPWIARKLAYLVHIMGMNIQVAKALIIDAAAKWELPSNSDIIGYGVVPERIEDILRTDREEIKFVITSTTDAYETVNYKIPVPTIKGQGKFPYIGRATMVYFPECNRSQGVDYTMTELDLKFGRVFWDVEHKRLQIDSLDNNRQATGNGTGIKEEDARDIYRKWDNVKRIAEANTGRRRPKDVKSNIESWGLSIISKERLTYTGRDHLKFGVVLTIRAVDGENRYDEFFELCFKNQWRVRKVSIDAQLDIVRRAEKEITLE